MTLRTPVLWAGLGLLLAATAQPHTARAQTDPMAAGRNALANQVGLMEFCQAQGFADADAVAAQRAAVARMPPAPAGAPSTDAAEALGRNGTLSANGTQTTLASLASSHNTTVAAMCGQMASSAKQVAGAFQSPGAVSGTPPPGIPAMPSNPGALTAVPGFPSGMPNATPGGMPSIPGMPGAPSAAPR